MAAIVHTHLLISTDGYNLCVFLCMWHPEDETFFPHEFLDQEISAITCSISVLLITEQSSLETESMASAASTTGMQVCLAF